MVIFIRVVVLAGMSVGVGSGGSSVGGDYGLLCVVGGGECGCCSGGVGVDEF